MDACASHPRSLRASPSARLIGVAVFALLPEAASAHVKWFAEFDLLCPPRPPFRVLTSPYFVAFCLAVAPFIFAITYLDRLLAGRNSRIDKHARWLTDRLSHRFPQVLRIGVSVFFVAVFLYGGMILTPELKTESPWVSALQLLIAIAALRRSSALVAGIGIVVLYAHAIQKFGVFHMLDYPIFLGVAAFLIIESLWGGRKIDLALAVVRIATGVTLLWASVEKWAFPEWSFGLIAEQPSLTFGFSPEFYMVAAGFVEFCAAFLLITGLLSARAAALVLLVFFLSAIAPFGMIDAIGHAVIIVVLVLLGLGHNGVAQRFESRGGMVMTATMHTSMFFAVLGAAMLLYYGGHYLSFMR